MMMNKLLQLLFSFAIATNVYAGDYFYGSGSDKELACANAENRAMASAKAKETCYKQCDIRKCVKEQDGTFTCSASSADHYGSCDPSMIKPSK